MDLTALRDRIDADIYANEDPIIAQMTDSAALDPEARAQIKDRATAMVEAIRNHGQPGLMEIFLAEYGLSTEEGIALMCLAEALLRVPDPETIDALIEDKIAPSNWGLHLGKSNSSLVNASTWGLMLTGRVLDEREGGVAARLRGALRRVGEPVIRAAVSRAMKEMGRQFVLGETIEKAMDRAAKMEAKGYTYSYDMLGEAARTDADALSYLEAYSQAISSIARAATHKSVAENPGISVKLSALHPRYEESQRDRVMAELVPRLLRLAREAAAHGLGFNVDAEEADRLSISLDVIEAVIGHESLKGWNGFGIVVQAYGKRAEKVIDWIYALSGKIKRPIMVRLVKGAYWDAEIKRAQVMGLEDFPVFTRKTATDISYLGCARKLLQMTDRIYPQFATHNAHTVAGVLHMAEEMERPAQAYEFQRLHGMGEVLHSQVMAKNGIHCRIYAPVGAHQDLLAYLVRRLLENGANSSFVNQIVDETVPASEIAASPWENLGAKPNIPTGPELYAPTRRNSEGHDLTHRPTRRLIEAGREKFAQTTWTAAPIVAFAAPASGEARVLRNPARPDDIIGKVQDATAEMTSAAFAAAELWDAPVATRTEVLNRVSDLFEARLDEIFALLAREAGKTLIDAEGELREAVDFLRYYGAQAGLADTPARGIWACISPWNFPLAIFTGQVAAALAAGNAVIAKPSEETSLIAHLAVEIFHEAGVPRTALQLLPGAGEIGAALTSDPRLAGVAFTGSTHTARLIRHALAQKANPATPFIAETGGLNAMVVDSTALPEHVVRDLIAGAFQSAGQRCSALRCLYVQEEIAPDLIKMLQGAMDSLRIGDPWNYNIDVGPVIDQKAKSDIGGYIQKAEREGRVLHQLDAPNRGCFVAPTLIKVTGIADLTHEVFGPVLHVASFAANQIDEVIAAINATGYGLTFGLHTRIDDRVQRIVDRVECGNIYVNRNQIGAVVGTQPFGGEGLSGTGPKAGGPRYLRRFQAPAPAPRELANEWSKRAKIQNINDQLREALRPKPDVEIRDMPGPTGESNRTTTLPRKPVLCLGPGPLAAAAQVREVTALGGWAISAGGSVSAEILEHELIGYSSVIWWGDEEMAREYDLALARVSDQGALIPLITTMPDAGHVLLERHVCVDTTAAGGNAQLLAQVAEDIA